MEQLPEGYEPKLDYFQTEEAIELVRNTFGRKLAKKLNLLKVQPEYFLKTGDGVQDDLGDPKAHPPVSFEMPFGVTVEMPHSLAKWKRKLLGEKGFAHSLYAGLYVDMKAVRQKETLSEIHSVHVDQWDWEKVISKEERSLEFLESTVKKIYSVVLETERIVEKKFGLEARLAKDITFVHTEDLEKDYPELTPKQREHEIAKEYGAVFLIGIGYTLQDGKPHDLRAADYDDWSTETKPGYHGLNGDIIVWDDTRKTSLELSSMGIRVDADALLVQLYKMKQYKNVDLDFQKSIIEERIPLSIGGGIGQSRLCMLLLQKAHIGEVQRSTWPDDIEERGIPLL